MVVFHAPGGAAYASWWMTDNGTATLGSSQGELGVGISSSSSQATVPHPNTGLGCVSPVGTVPLRLRRSPVLRHRTKHESLSEMEGEPGPTSDAEGETLPSLLKQLLGYQGSPHAYTTPVTSAGATPQDWPRAGQEEPQAGTGTEGEQPPALAQTVGNAQDSAALDQRRPVLGREEPALGQ